MRVSARRKIAKGLTATAVVMVVSAVGVGAYPFYTDLRANVSQDNLKDQFASDEAEKTFRRGAVQEGKPLTRLVISRLGVDMIVVEGTSQKSLRAGAGHYRETPLPGEAGNVAIAGHSGLHGKPFTRLARLRRGDLITLITPIARHDYQVIGPFGNHANPWVTEPNDWSVINSDGSPALTLTTCYPNGSAKQRLIARAALISSKPL